MWQEQYESDNIYEGEIRYENNRVVFGNLPSPPPGETSPAQENVPVAEQQIRPKHESATSRTNQGPTNAIKWTIASIVFYIIIILLLIALLIQNGLRNEVGKARTVHTTTQPPTYGNASAQEVERNLSVSLDPSIFVKALDKLVADRTSTPVKSCQELRRLGFKTDGIYYIQTNESYSKTEVYCDMTSDDGGWTLVASIHESNISVKCDVDDMWSTHDLRNVIGHTDKTNWKTKNIFGNLINCAKNNYKNAAYHNLQASDIMVWHVDPKFSLSSMKQNAYLRYRTNNQFLERHGGNLKTLYEQHYPLKIKGSDKSASNVLNALVQNAGKIRSQIHDWYDYTYGDDSSHVKDSGMYSSYGNEITIRQLSKIEYERKYRYASDCFVDSRMTSPFILINLIENKRRQETGFYTYITSYRPNTNEDYTILSNNITSGNYHLQYHALQYSSPNIPTPCEFHFVVSSDNWRSVEPSRFWNNYRDNPRSTRRASKFEIDGYPANVVMGYMLLARTAGKSVTLEQSDQVAKIILESLMTLPKLFKEHRTAKVIHALSEKSADIVQVIPDWYMYTFQEGRRSVIFDNNLYDPHGNQVYIFSSKEDIHFLTYGAMHAMNGHRNVVGTRNIQPFIMVNVISNEDRLITYFTTNIITRGMDCPESIVSKIENIISEKNYKIQYKVLQFPYLDQPTPVQFHFVLSNVEKWKSVEPASFTEHHGCHSGSRSTDLQITGSPSNIVMGYLLLTRQNGTNVTRSQSDAVARIVLDAIASVDNLFNEYPGNEALAVPVTFDKGNSNEVLDMVPHLYKKHVEPGFLQFRAYNVEGFPNALCPGVRVKSQRPEYSCIGGLSNDLTEYGTCGDFAGWGGKEGDTNAPMSANGSAHSQRDISSAILIFYR